MADRKKSKETPMSIEDFRAKKAGAGSSTSSQKTTTNEAAKSSTTKTTSSAGQESRSRPQTASKSKAPRSRSASVDDLNSSSISIQARQEKVKQLRNKQIEDTKKKNEERRLAFEERKKKRDEEEKKKWEALKQQAAMQRPGSGRKLPTLPGGPKRPASASAGPSRPTALPKSLKTTSSSKLPGQGTAKSPAKSPAQSSSSHSSDSSPRQSPTTHGKSLLSAKRAGSSTNLANENRRASTSNLSKPSTASRNRPSSIHGPDSKLSTSKSHNSLSTSTHTVKKAQSTSALHRIGTDKPHHPKRHAEKQEKPKAGLLDEAAAKQALAERRKQAREEAERKAKLDLERQEEERKKKEEEEKRLAEEMAKEEERVRQLAELLKQQNEEKMKKAAEEKEKRDKEEAERLVAEEKQREEERKIKEEEERIAKIEAEKKAKEDEERRKKEELERKERRRRVEEIMSRTRQAKTDSPNPDSTETSSTPPQEIKPMDMEDTKRKVSEILQKVKDRTDSVSPVSSVDSELSSTVSTVQDVQHKQETACESESTIDNGKEEQLADEMENPKPIQEVTGVASGNDSVIKVRVRISETRTEVKVNGREVQRTLSQENASKNEHLNGNNVSSEETDGKVLGVEDSNDNTDGTSIGPNGSINGLDKRECADVAG